MPAPLQNLRLPYTERAAETLSPTIFDGTSEIHRGLVARAALKKGPSLFDIGG